MEREIDLGKIVKVLMSKIVVVIIACAVGFCGAFVASKLLISPRYSSQAKLYVETKNQTKNDNITATDIQTSQKLVLTYIQLLGSDDFLQDVANAAQVSYKPEQLSKMIDLKSLNQTEVLSITVTTKSKEESYNIANKYIELGRQRLENLVQGGRISIVDTPKKAESPSSPNVRRNSVIGGLLGIIISAAIIILKEIFNDKITCEEDLTSKYDIPVLGGIPNFDE